MTLIKKPFVFARHAQSTYNAAHLIGGSTDSPLSDIGIQQAQNAAERLGLIIWSAVFTSTLKRTQQTAFYAVPKQEVIPHAQLTERHWGDLEGCSIDLQTPYEITPPNGESWQVFEDRIIGALNDILGQYEKPLIIAHSGVYRVLNKVINGTPYCPRVDNLTPIFFEPSQNDNGWSITPIKGKFL